MFLDGIRALSALYVVAHHIYITVYPGYPRSTGPWYLGWLIYGQFAVAVFIVVSGFSLTLAPARHGFASTSSYWRFMQRRAWRIIPPYWAALFLSVLLVLLIRVKIDYAFSAKGVGTHFLLLQDIFSGPSPNGAFWSIAVEWQLYFFFPLFLFLRRRIGAVATAAFGLVGVWLVYLAAVHFSPLARLLHLTPQFAALFIFGIVAAGATQRIQNSGRRVPWAWISLALWVGLVAWCAYVGSIDAIADFYWTDLVIGAAVATGLAALVERERSASRRTLESRPLTGVGHFSYSLYLVHSPLVLVAWLFIVQPMHLSQLAEFAIMIVAVAPVIVAICYGFFRVFERPFLNNRSFRALLGRGDVPTSVAA